MTILLIARRPRSEREPKMSFMYRWGRAGIAAFALSGVSGCAAPPSSLSSSSIGESLSVRQLPDVPGCDTIAAVGTLRAVAIQGEPNLYLVTEAGKPICIDDGAGVAAFEARNQLSFTVSSSSIHVPHGEVDSNPMPCRDPGLASSDPMPMRPSGEPNAQESNNSVGQKR